MTKFRFAVLACMLLAIALLQGCGDSGCALVSLGEAAPERRAEFTSAVAAALRGFEDLDSQGVQIAVVDEKITVRGGRIKAMDLENALSVALTNMALKYPGIGFMATGDGGWIILMPSEMKIPEQGDFGLEFK